MKKIWLFAVLTLAVILPGRAQDRLVTWGNDTIACHITANHGRFIRFTVYQNGIPTQGRLDKKEVKNIYYAESSRPAAEPKPDFNPWRLELSGGLAFMLGSTSDGRKEAADQGLTKQQVDDYYQQIMTGWQASANMHYFLQPDMALGLSYRFFQTKADLWATFDPQDGMNLYHGQMIESMYVNFIGPSLLSTYTFSQNQQWRLVIAVAAGPAFFRDETSLLETNVLLTGKAFGLNTDIGLEYFVAPRVSLGLKLGLFASNISKVTMDDGYNSTTIKLEDEERQNLSSLDLTAGLRIYF